jgi:hypothetical protein
MYLQKVISRKNFLYNYFFVCVLKVNDENSRGDQLVRGMDPRIRIRIRTTMSWIRRKPQQWYKLWVSKIHARF